MHSHTHRAICFNYVNHSFSFKYLQGAASPPAGKIGYECVGWGQRGPEGGLALSWGGHLLHGVGVKEMGHRSPRKGTGMQGVSTAEPPLCDTSTTQHETQSVVMYFI